MVRLLSHCLLFLLCFFFFKQKTAYEMRISDWSSDVCSSDLLQNRVRIHRRRSDDARSCGRQRNGWPPRSRRSVAETGCPAETTICGPDGGSRSSCIQPPRTVVPHRLQNESRRHDRFPVTPLHLPFLDFPTFTRFGQPNEET